MNKDRLLYFVNGIEGHLMELERMKALFDEDARGFKEAVAFAYKQAKEEGIDPRALRTAIKVRTIERKISQYSSGPAYEQIRLHLGDLVGTPLGNFAEQKAIEGNGESHRRSHKEEIERVPTIAPHAYASDVKA